VERYWRATQFQPEEFYSIQVVAAKVDPAAPDITEIYNDFCFLLS